MGRVYGSLALPCSDLRARLQNPQGKIVEGRFFQTVLIVEVDIEMTHRSVRCRTGGQAHMRPHHGLAGAKHVYATAGKGHGRAGRRVVANCDPGLDGGVEQHRMQRHDVQRGEQAPGKF